VSVTDLVVHTDGGPEGKGYIVVTFAANGTGGPSCASGYPRSIAIGFSTPGGAFSASILQTALLGALMPMTVTGTGACTIVPKSHRQNRWEVARPCAGT